jgi:hypothetical protein
MVWTQRPPSAVIREAYLVSPWVWCYPSRMMGWRGGGSHRTLTRTSYIRRGGPSCKWALGAVALIVVVAYAHSIWVVRPTYVGKVQIIQMRKKFPFRSLHRLRWLGRLLAGTSDVDTSGQRQPGRPSLQRDEWDGGVWLPRCRRWWRILRRGG